MNQHMKKNKALSKWVLTGIVTGLSLSLSLQTIANQKESATPQLMSRISSQKNMQPNTSSKPSSIMDDSSGTINHLSGKHHQHTIISPDDKFLITHTDRIPNFAQKYTAINLTSGKWSNADIWRDGHIPRDGDIVRIASNTKVIYDIASDTRINSIGVAGHLDFSTKTATRLRVTTLLIYQDGSLQIGTSTEPVSSEFSAEIIINDQPLDAGTVEKPGSDPGQYANGVLVWGALTLHGASITPTFLRLAEASLKGSSELVLSTKPEGWRVGDRILIPDSRQILENDSKLKNKAHYNIEGSRGIVADPMLETAEIAQINGNRLELSRPIRFHHPGATNLSGSPIVLESGTRLLPHVANITRNIIIRSENPQGARGHTICFRNSLVHISNTLFKDLGRTTVAKLDNTVYDTENAALKIGTNQIARYPVHMHHHTDPMRVSGTRYEYILTGNVVETAPRWGIVIHSTHFGLVKDNVVFNAAGAGIATEDGSETGNHFEHNFIAGVSGSGKSVNSHKPAEGLGHEGSGFWLGSDNNTLINNVVAGVRDSGYTLFRSKRALPYPDFPNLELASPNTKTDQNIEKWFKFQNNEVYGSAGNGIELWDDEKRKVSSIGISRIVNTIIWHSRNGVNYDYHADHYDIDGLIVRGDPKKLESTTGVLANLSRRAIILNSDIKYVGTGIEGGGARNRQLVIKNGDILARTGIRIFRGSSWSGMQPVQIKNVRLSLLDTATSEGSGKLIELKTGSNYKRRALPVMFRPIHVTHFQGKTGENLQIFYPDQAPDSIIPQNPDKYFGCPVAGLTNKQCLQQFGIAMGGELASCNKSITGVDGFSCTDD